MVKLSDIEASDHVQAMQLRRKWKEDRGLYPVVGLPNDVMRYIERLEARLSIAVPALQSIATPALGGKSQQYTAQHALKALEQHEREEAR